MLLDFEPPLLFPLLPLPKSEARKNLLSELFEAVSILGLSSVFFVAWHGSSVFVVTIFGGLALVDADIATGAAGGFTVTEQNPSAARLRLAKTVTFTVFVPGELKKAVVAEFDPSASPLQR